MATTSRFPDWCMFDPFVWWSKQLDASTILQANSETSHGVKISIGVKIDDPPAPSHLHATFADSSWTHGPKFQLLVAHRGALLLQMIYAVPFPEGAYEYPRLPVIDYFIYKIDGPSLERLPSLEGSFDEVFAQCKARSGIMVRLLGRTFSRNIGLMCRGEEGEFAVAELLMHNDSKERKEYWEVGEGYKKELPVLNVLLRCPSSSSPLRWEEKRSHIIRPTCTNPDEPSWLDGLLSYFRFKADVVLPFGDKYLCWVVYYHGIVLCDVFADKPGLRGLQLPAISNIVPAYHDQPWKTYSQLVGVTKGGVLKFVRVDVSQVCARDRKHSVFKDAFTITSWTLWAKDHTGMEPLEWEWEQDGSLTSDELSHLVEGFTQQHLCKVPHVPLVSMDDPNIICLVMRSIGFWPGRREWTLTIDVTNKKLVSSFLHTKQKQREEHPTCLSPHIASEVAKQEYACSNHFLPVDFSKHLHMNLPGTRVVDLLEKEVLWRRDVALCYPTFVVWCRILAAGLIEGLTYFC